MDSTITIQLTKPFNTKTMKYILNTIAVGLFTLAISGILFLTYNLIFNGVSGDFGTF